MITTHFTHASVLALNALLVESPSSLAEHFATDTPSLICQGISHKDVCPLVSATGSVNGS